MAQAVVTRITMRRGIALLALALLLSGCAEAEGPELPAPPPPTPTAVVARVSASAAPATPSAPPTRETATARPPTPTGEPSAGGTETWPHLLRSLDLGLAAGNSYTPRALALHPELDRLYVRTQGFEGYPRLGYLAMLDPQTGEVLRAVSTGLDDYAAGDLAVDATRDQVYVGNPQDPSISVLDAATLEPVAVLDGLDRFEVDAGRGRLYAAAWLPAAEGSSQPQAPSSVQALDVDGWRVLDEFPLPPEARVGDLALDAVAGRLYVALEHGGDYELLILSAGGEAADGGLDLLETVPLPGMPTQLLADPERGLLYLSSQDSDSSWLQVRDSDGAQIESRRLGDWSRQTVLALDLQRGRLFLGRDSYQEHGVEVFDLSSGQIVADLPLAAAPGALLWDGARGLVWASHPWQNRIAAIEGDTGLARGLYPTAITLLDLDLDPARSHLYVSESSGTLRILDSDTDRELGRVLGGARISVDAPHGRFYAGGGDLGTVRVYASERLELVGVIPSSGLPVADAHSGGLYIVNQGIHIVDLGTLTVTGVISDTLPQMPGFSPNPKAVDAVVDAGSGRVYAIISNGVPGSNGGSYLYVYEPGSFEKVLEDTERSPRFIDVDPGTGLAYVSRIHLAGSSTSLLSGGSLTVARVEGLYGALRVDPGLGRLYVSVEGDSVLDGQLLVLDSRSLEVLESLPIEPGFSLAALDPRRRWLYLANEQGSVQIWSETGGQASAGGARQPGALWTDGPLRRLYLPPSGRSFYATDEIGSLYANDGDGTWRAPGGGLPGPGIADIAFSPDYAQDRTVFVGGGLGQRGHGVWVSRDGGQTWRLSSRGLTDLQVTSLVVSPDYARDRTLFAGTARAGLFRSVDGGQHWALLSYGTPDPYRAGPRRIVLSPTFAQDRTLFVESGGWWRSQDGGDSWSALADMGGGYFQYEVVPAPDFASSRVVYALALPNSAGTESFVLGSADAGNTWKPVGRGPTVYGSGEWRTLVSPAGALYVTWKPFSWVDPSRLFRSIHAGAHDAGPAGLEWEEWTGPVPDTSTPLELTADGSGLAALDRSGRLLSWAVDGLDWKAAPKPTPRPTSTPVPVCLPGPELFRAVWEQERERLGCPAGPAQRLALAEQQFERAHMLWESDTLQIYVLLEDGTWLVFADTFQEGADPEWDVTLAPPPRQPKRGFGKVWRQELGGPAAETGWALSEERGVDGWRLRSANGLLLWTDAVLPGAGYAGTAFLLYADGAWQVMPAARP